MGSKKKSILYSLARNDKGVLVNAVDAEKGERYLCPVCSGEFILRKSGKTGKNTKRPHFAHKCLTPNCTPETSLHYLFKTLAYEKIKQAIKTNEPINFDWHCKYCSSPHKGNLLKKIKDVKLEYNLLKQCQPDIALLDKDNKVFCVIEIVVTHKPDEQALKYYKENDIILIQINLSDDQDLMDINLKLSHPDLVDICFNPKCKNCGCYLLKSIMMIIDGPCWKCGSIMKVATIHSQNHGMMNGGSNYVRPDGFTKEQMKLARSKGVILEARYSVTAQDKYVANVCGKCNAFAGNFHFFTEYIAPAGYGDLESEAFVIGYHCESCIELS